MPQNYLFVSCDIVAHSEEQDILLQCNKIIALNLIVGDVLEKSSTKNIIWASGGDGGHVCFPEKAEFYLAINLIYKLCKWTHESNIKLRIIACYGLAESIKGADGRIQLVGHGINTAGNLLELNNGDSIIITEAFYSEVKDIITQNITIHDNRMVNLKNLGLQSLYLYSIENLIRSNWENTFELSDSHFIEQALKKNDFLEIVYRAKRLIQINTEDTDAANALKSLALGKVHPQFRKTFLYDLFLDIEFGPDFIRAGSLIERKAEELVCMYDDDGETMFFVLKGKLGVYLPELAGTKDYNRQPDFIVAPGELTGEIAFALKRKRTATLKCLQDVSLLSFSYNKIFRSFSNAKAKEKIANLLNKNVLAKVLEHLWNTSLYLSQSIKASNLSIAPWLELLPFSKITSVQWKKNFLNPTQDFKDIGLIILASGRLERNSDKKSFDGIDYPILYANFSENDKIQSELYQLLTDSKIIVIHRQGLFKLHRNLFKNLEENINKLFFKAENLSIAVSGNIGLKKNVAKKNIFLSYAHDNMQEVLILRKALIDNGVNVWWDQDILAGQDWKFEIRQSLKRSDLVILCLSKETEQRNKTGIYPEALDAIASLREYHPGHIFLIPVRLSECEIPMIEIDSIRTLDRLQHVNLFPGSEWQKGFQKLLKAISSDNNN